MRSSLTAGSPPNSSARRRQLRPSYLVYSLETYPVILGEPAGTGKNAARSSGHPQHYLEGKIEQFWFRENVGPIFLMNVESVEEAKATLSELPLVANNLVRLELMPVGPLMPLSLLIQGK
jgi:hypothetical protein